MAHISQLAALKSYFQSGATRPYKFRIEQLKRLKDAIMSHEEELYGALKTDLRKSAEETWVTESGFVVNEIKSAIKHLDEWMRPELVATNLLNLPSSSSIVREPLGVVLIISPWNYPFNLLIDPLVGAIAAGNCVVIKPSEFAPATAAVIRKIITANFPPEYLLFIEGDGARVIPEMMNNFSFDHVFYTGSTSTGKAIYKMAAERLVPVTLELGGKSPCVVEEDANIRVAARRITGTKFSNAGQMCVAPDYVLVHESRKDELLKSIRDNIVKFFGEDASGSYDFCQMINEKQFDRVVKYLEQGTIYAGGQTNRDKLFIQPTLLTDVSLDAEVMNEEIFGPVLPIITYSGMEEALSIIQRNPNPLSFYIYTSSDKRAQAWLGAVPSGGACINNSSWHLTNKNLPFGGRGFSGMGNYHGKYSFETFSHRKAVMKTPTWFDPSIKYPSFKGKLGLFKKFAK